MSGGRELNTSIEAEVLDADPKAASPQPGARFHGLDMTSQNIGSETDRPLDEPLLVAGAADLNSDQRINQTRFASEPEPACLPLCLHGFRSRRALLRTRPIRLNTPSLAVNIR